MNKVVAIIQARMGSTRLPGKVLREINGKPMLYYQIERIKRSEKVDEIVIATTNIGTEQGIVDFCTKNKLRYFKGDEKNVLSRYYAAAMEFKADTIVRITSDCPLFDPLLLDHGIDLFMKQGSAIDYLSNTLVRSYPRGMDFEIFTMNALRKAFNYASSASELEHVTPYLYSEKNNFVLKNMENEVDYSSIRLTVDTLEDFEVVTHILNHFDHPENVSWLDIVHYLNENQEIMKINEMVEQKSVGES